MPLPRAALYALGTAVVLGGAFMGGLGLFAGIFANKFDQMAAITNFIVTPLAFLSGTFYSVEALPPLAVYEPMVNMIFETNDSPFAGREGKFLTSRQIKDRLAVETLRNVAIDVRPTERADAFLGCLLVGRVRLVTTSCSPQEARYCLARRSMNSLTSGRA